MAILLIKLAVAYIIKDYEIEVGEGTNIHVDSTAMNVFSDVSGKFVARFKSIGRVNGFRDN